MNDAYQQMAASAICHAASTVSYTHLDAKFAKFVLDEAQETSCGVMEVKTIARGNSTVN